jgi:hypothetical protein
MTIETAALSSRRTETPFPTLTGTYRVYLVADPPARQGPARALFQIGHYPCRAPRLDSPAGSLGAWRIGPRAPRLNRSGVPPAADSSSCWS